MAIDKLDSCETSRDWADVRGRRLVKPKTKASPIKWCGYHRLHSEAREALCSVKNAEAYVTYLFHDSDSDGSQGHMKYICRSCGIS